MEFRNPFAPPSGATLPYTVVCALIGAVLGWLPMFVHGPIAEKWSYFYLDGTIMVWGWVVARLSIGLLVGMTSVPRAWWLRGPICGALVMLPLGIVSLGNPMCGDP